MSLPQPHLVVSRWISASQPSANERLFARAVPGSNARRKWNRPHHLAMMCLFGMLLSLVGCALPPAPGSTGCGPGTSVSTIPVRTNVVDSADILFEIDNSNSMSENQANLARSFQRLINQLVSPPINPTTMRPEHTPVKSVHIAVISSDLGTPGSVVPSCANTDTGDDGRLNPIKSGLAIRTHQPWTTSPAGRRPARCTNDLNQYPSFLTFTAGVTNATDFSEDFVCNAYLSVGGCGLEQQLESAYRALVVRNPREQVGNTDPNAGFVRNDAVLAIVMVTDEEDGSTRDCRFAESGVPCTDAVGVFDIMSPEWSSSDLNLRFYMYTPGSRQDPTWALDRYIDPLRPSRGFTSLKPGRPDLVIFHAIAGVPLDPPMRAAPGGSGMEIDYDALLGRVADGSDGYTGEQTGSGHISMRQRNMDPMCPTRVVPACRREGAPAVTTCDGGTQYFAWPSRRIAQVARRFSEQYHTGFLNSICANDYSPFISQIATEIGSRFATRCLASPINTVPSACEPGDSRQGCARINCQVREILPLRMAASEVCTAARGRIQGARDVALQRDTCVVRQVAVLPGGAPLAGQEGFYYDTRSDPMAPECTRHIEFTSNAGITTGAYARLECVPSGYPLPDPCL